MVWVFAGGAKPSPKLEAALKQAGIPIIRIKQQISDTQPLPARTVNKIADKLGLN